MYGPYGTVRPEIARVAEETVLHLKQVESRIEVLCNDLAQLCTAVGHHEAARLAVTPVRAWLSPGNIPGSISPYNAGSLGNIGTPHGQAPWTGATPSQSPGIGGFSSPYGTPFPGAPGFGAFR